MKLRLLFSLLWVSLTCSLTAQTTILDFEDAATSTVFQYFGSSLEPGTTSVIPNPDASGINTSANVSDFMKPADAQTWAGGFSNPQPSVAVDVTAGNMICMKVWFANPGNVALKLEQGGEVIKRNPEIRSVCS